MSFSKIAVQLLLLAACNASAIGPRAAQAPTTSPKPPAFLGQFGVLIASLNGKDTVKTLQAALPKARIARTTTLKPQLRAEAKRVDVQYGPYTLAGRNEPRAKGFMGSLDPKGQGFVDLISEGLCTNCTVLAGRTKLTFEDGSEAGPVNGIYIHHVINRDLTKPVNLPVSKCGAGQVPRLDAGRLGSEFLVQGDDSQTGGSILFTSQDGKFNSGYFVGPQMILVNQVDLVNYNTESKKVFVNYEIEYVDGHVGSDAAATLMSVTGCADPAGHDNPAGHQGGIKLDPQGVAITESPKFAVTKDAKIVTANGHMHDGGSKMILLVNGKQTCESDAIYGKGGSNNDETILNMSGCPEGVPIKKGDFLQLKSVYDLKKHPLREGSEHNSQGMPDVMGMFFMTFSVD